MAPDKNERLRLKAEVFKAMGHPLRLGVIEFLRDGEKCVCDIVDHLGYRHIQHFQTLVSAEKGRHRHGPERRPQDDVQPDHALRVGFHEVRGRHRDQEAR